MTSPRLEELLADRLAHHERAVINQGISPDGSLLSRAAAKRRTRYAVRGVVAATAAVALLGGAMAVANTPGLGEPGGNDQPRPSDDVQPAPSGDAVTFLVAGLDAREVGADANAEPTRADTILLVHIPAARDRVDVVWIPRDIALDGVTCETTGGTVIDLDGMPLSAATQEAEVAGDAAACLVRSVEALTDVRIDHYALATYQSLSLLVDQLGGVELCLSEDAQWPQLGVDIPAGTSLIPGETAVAFARARRGDGLSGSDLDRVERNQLLLGAIGARILDSGALKTPGGVVDLVSSFISSAQSDATLDDAATWAELAFSLRDIEASDITLTTLPVGVDTEDPNRLALGDEAALVLDALRTDSRLPVTHSDVPTQESIGC